MSREAAEIAMVRTMPCRPLCRVEAGARFFIPGTTTMGRVIGPGSHGGVIVEHREGHELHSDEWSGLVHVHLPDA